VLWLVMHGCAVTFSAYTQMQDRMGRWLKFSDARLVLSSCHTSSSALLWQVQALLLGLELAAFVRRPRCEAPQS
jgi:hypothetical protein